MNQVKIAKTQVIRKGVFDLKTFYIFVHSFIMSMLGYDTFNEDDYYQSKSGDYQELEFHWTFTKSPDNYTKFRLWIECKVRDIKTVKVKVGDDVVSRHDAELEFNLKGTLITDPDSKWAKHPILKHFQWFYERFFYKTLLDDYIVRFWEHIINIQNEVKDFFGLPKM